MHNGLYILLLRPFWVLAQPGGGEMTMKFRLFEPDGRTVYCHYSDYKVLAYYTNNHDEAPGYSSGVTEIIPCSDNNLYSYFFNGSGIGLPSIPPNFRILIIHGKDTMHIRDSYSMDSIPFRPGRYTGIPPSGFMRKIVSQSSSRINNSGWNIEDYKEDRMVLNLKGTRISKFSGEPLVTRDYLKPIANTGKFLAHHQSGLVVFKDSVVEKVFLADYSYQSILSHAPDSFSLADIQPHIKVEKNELMWDKIPLLNLVHFNEMVFLGSDIVFMKVTDVAENNKRVSGSTRLYQSNDGGYTWKRAWTELKPDFIMMHRDGRLLISDYSLHILIDSLGKHQLLDLSSVSREAWGQKVKTARPSGVSFFGNGTAYMLVDDFLMRSKDNGKSWHQILAGFTSSLVLVNEKELLVEMNYYGRNSMYSDVRGNFLYSNDAGENWYYMDLDRCKLNDSIEENTIIFMDNQSVFLRVAGTRSSKSQSLYQQRELKLIDLMESERNEIQFLNQRKWSVYGYYAAIADGTYIIDYRQDPTYGPNIIIKSGRYRYEPNDLNNANKLTGASRERWINDFHKGFVEGQIAFNDSMVTFIPDTDKETWLKGTYYYEFNGYSLHFYTREQLSPVKFKYHKGEMYGFELKKIDLLKQGRMQPRYAFTPEQYRFYIEVRSEGVPITGAEITYGKIKASGSHLPGRYYFDKRMILNYYPDGKYWQKDETGIDLNIRHPDYLPVSIPFKKSSQQRYEMTLRN
jgi:hypothetical protein